MARRFAPALLLLAHLSVGCAPAPESADWRELLAGREVSKKELTAAVRGAILESGHAEEVETLGSLRLAIRQGEDYETEISLENLMAVLSDAPEERPQQVEAFLRGLFSSPVEEITPELLTAVLPVVRDQTFLDNVQRVESADDPVLAQPYVGDLFVFYVLDRPEAMQFLKVADLELLRVDEAGMEAQALANLEALLPQLERQSQGAITRISLDGFYEASLILLDGLWPELEASLEGNLVVAVPARDLLAFADGADREAVRALDGWAKQAAAEQAYAVTGALLERVGASWEVLDNVAR